MLKSGSGEMVWPKERVICSDVRIPQEIREDLNRASQYVDISPDAAAGLVRRSLERLLRKYLTLSGRDRHFNCTTIQKKCCIQESLLFLMLSEKREILVSLKEERSNAQKRFFMLRKKGSNGIKSRFGFSYRVVY